MIFDHVDLRVRDARTVRSFYDALLRPFGFRPKIDPDGNVIYIRIADHKLQEAVALISDPTHRPNGTRLAFHADSPQEVDRIAAIALRVGAVAYEAPMWCPEIGELYYASFFEDPSGNRLEIVSR